MKNISEYDVRQLKLMLQSLASFASNFIELDSLIGTLEFLLSVMETIDEDFRDNFLEPIGDLETINSIEIDNENGEEFYEINPMKKKKSSRMLF